MKSISLLGPSKSSHNRAWSLPSLTLHEAEQYDTDEEYSATSAVSNYSNQLPVTPVSFASKTTSDDERLNGAKSTFRHRSLSATAKTLGRKISKLRPRNASFSGSSRPSVLPSVSEIFTECKAKPHTAYVIIEEIPQICPGDLDNDAIVLWNTGDRPRISDHKLQVGTSEIRAYRMKHRNAELWTSKDIILVDTPDLSHERKTEWWVLSQIKKWMEDNGITNIDRLLYFDRISDNRMRRSRGRSSAIFKSICGKQAASRALVITTMWDEMWNDRLKTHAANRYNDLKQEYWKEFVQQGCRIEKFENNFATAIRSLQQFSPTSDPDSIPLFVLEQNFLDEALRETDAGRMAFQALQERQENLIASQQAIMDDIRFAAGPGLYNHDLSEILQTQYSTINEDILELMRQIQEYSSQYTELREEIKSRFDRPDSRASSLGSGLTGKSRLRSRLQDWLLRLRSINVGRGTLGRRSSGRMYTSAVYSQSSGALPCLSEIPD
ncbi:hypothetical protein BJ165DRAFT_1524133 [Panaeolus papilionaceus]|nr:hypothetical protein BJ165DRAFT_1524133 [Panaeolus papilionaceus]